MMVDKDDLGLSLSLRCSTTVPTTTNHGRAPTASSDLQQLRNRSTFPMNLMPPSPLFASSSSNSSSSSSLPLANLPFHPAAAVQRPSPWLDCFPSSDRTGGGGGAVAVSSGGAGDPRSFLRGIDVNRPPVSVADDEEPGASSPNSSISSLSGKRSEREVVVIDVSAGEDLDIACTRGNSDEEDADACRKKLRLSKDQSAVLEDSFKEHNTLNPKQKLALAKKLGLRPRQVEVWFQNRRARTKLKQTEVDCEFLKRCCEQMTEENRRLQKEVQELRALKLSPQFYMQMTPPTTLTMCPSCERVSPPTSSSGSASAASAAVQHRGMAMNPWGLAPGGGPFRSFEGLRGRP